MSTIVPIRLSALEVDMLDGMWQNSNTTGFESRSEFMRMLLHREWNKRRNLQMPNAGAWQGAHRRGTGGWPLGRKRKVAAS